MTEPSVREARPVAEQPSPPAAEPIAYTLKRGTSAGERPSPAEVAETAAYMRERMLFMPRMFQRVIEHNPAIGRAFADYYAEGKQDRHLSRAVKELIFTAIGIATASPACLIHLIPALEAGATREQLLETALVGTFAAGFIPGRAGVPYAAPYAAKVLETADRYLAGGPWEYAKPAEFAY